MCYAVYISTDSSIDLSEQNTDLLRFRRIADPDPDPCTVLLEFPHQWYVGSKSGCSCTFRHLHTSAVGFGFGEPEEWCPEEQEQIDATKELFSVLAHILSSGYALDLVDRWEGSQPKEITTLDVSLDQFSEKTFRMFEDHKFTLMKGKSRTEG